MVNNIKIGQVVAKISFAFCLVSVISVFVCKKWRSRLFSAKIILGIKSIFELMHALSLAFFDPRFNSIYCTMQANFVQFFYIGSWIYYGLLMIETNYLIENLDISQRTLTKEGKFRHLIYHSIVFIYGLVVVIWINITHQWGLSGAWCWLANPNDRVYLGYIPLWISILLIIFFDMKSIRFLRRILKSRRVINVVPIPSPDFELTTAAVHPVNSGNNLVLNCNTKRPFFLHNSPRRANNTASTVAAIDSQSPHINLSKKTLLVFLRLIIIPIIFILIHIPGTVNRFTEAAQITLSDQTKDFFLTAQAICDPSEGIWNAIIWVFTDAEALEELKVFFLQVTWLIISFVVDDEYSQDGGR